MFTLRSARILLLACAIITATATAPAEEEWIELFNGKNLDNWEVKGGEATYKMEDGAIVGMSAPNTQNTFLVTKEHYGDFILEFEFFGHTDLNSGVQIRSNSLPDYKDGRVHGYQIELEENSRDRDWSGGIYDEGRRGWLYPKDGDEQTGARFSEQGKKIWKENDWNTVRVEAIGDSIKTWVNGELRADLKDDMTPTGFIGLQVHGVGSRDELMTVKWRNIRLQQVEAEADPEPENG